MSKYSGVIRETGRAYLDMLAEEPEKNWKNRHHYTFAFLNNMIDKLAFEVNDYQMNREVSYATRLMIELGLSDVGTERRRYQRLFWPIDGEVPPFGTEEHNAERISN